MKMLEDKEVQDVLIAAVSQRKKLSDVLKALGLSWHEVVSYIKEDIAFAGRWEDALTACAEGIFDELLYDLSSISEFNAQSRKAKLEYAKYVLKILNPQKFIDKQELSVKHQQIIPSVHITLTSPREKVIEVTPTKKLIGDK